MKIETLEKLVRKSNKDSLQNLLHEREALRPLFTAREHNGDSVVVGGLGGDPATPPENAGNSIPADISNVSLSPCFCGVLRNRRATAGDYLDCIILKETTKRGIVWVGSVIDKQTQTSASDLPVVLAIGINYGQGPNYLNAKYIPGVFDNTQMRYRVGNAFSTIKKECDIQTPPDDYHLVAANFFPWITSGMWSGYNFNAIEEALFIACYGYTDPFARLIELLRLFENEKGEYWLIFHGANNAVPYMAVQFLARLRSEADWEALKQQLREILFSGNLAWQSVVANAVKLCLAPTTITRSDLKHRIEE